MPPPVRDLRRIELRVTLRELAEEQGRTRERIEAIIVRFLLGAGFDLVDAGKGPDLAEPSQITEHPCRDVIVFEQWLAA